MSNAQLKKSNGFELSIQKRIPSRRTIIIRRDDAGIPRHRAVLIASLDTGIKLGGAIRSLCAKMDIYNLGKVDSITDDESMLRLASISSALSAGPL
jgi:hypothetical protein